VFGVETIPKEVRVREQTVNDWSYDGSDKVVTVHIKDANRDWSATVRQ
jgi:hypothetical protein